MQRTHTARFYPCLGGRGGGGVGSQLFPGFGESVVGRGSFLGIGRGGGLGGGGTFFSLMIHS